MMAMIVAEVGQNHLGDMTLAKRLIVLAKENGADLAKFQLFDTDKLYEKGTDLYRQAKKAELSFEQAKMLFDYGQEVGIEVFFSVFDVERVRWCEEMGVKRYKVKCDFIHFPSGRNIDLVNALVKTGEEVFISYSHYPDNPDCFPSNWEILYCVPKYPASLCDLDREFANFFGADPDWLPYDGFSDHTIGLDAAKFALARNAKIIEKHFAIDHKTGVDAEWSMDYNELRELKRWADICEQVL